MTETFSILAFYAFAPQKADELPAFRQELLMFGKEHALRGLVLLATEGINGTVCGDPAAIDAWKNLLLQKFPTVTLNASSSERQIYIRWLVKIREEIVALNMPDSSPLNGTHLTPLEWNAMMEQEDTVVIDARNTYETQIGMFENAIDPKIENFQQFSEFAETCDLPKDKNILLYCTGGIRCEKAISAMKKAGYDRTYQLKGGILSYLRECPDGKFNGECFVFDHRVAVDAQLKPSSTYKLCSSCGNPGTVPQECIQCSKKFIACEGCIQKHAKLACSKNCQYHYQRQYTSCK